LHKKTPRRAEVTLLSGRPSAWRRCRGTRRDARGLGVRRDLLWCTAAPERGDPRWPSHEETRCPGRRTTLRAAWRASAIDRPPWRATRATCCLRAEPMLAAVRRRWPSLQVAIEDVHGLRGPRACAWGLLTVPASTIRRLQPASAARGPVFKARDSNPRPAAGIGLHYAVEAAPHVGRVRLRAPVMAASGTFRPTSPRCRLLRPGRGCECVAAAWCRHSRNLPAAPPGHPSPLDRGRLPRHAERDRPPGPGFSTCRSSSDHAPLLGDRASPWHGQRSTGETRSTSLVPDAGRPAWTGVAGRRRLESTISCLNVREGCGMFFAQRTPPRLPRLDGGPCATPHLPVRLV